MAESKVAEEPESSQNDQITENVLVRQGKSEVHVHFNLNLHSNHGQNFHGAVNGDIVGTTTTTNIRDAQIEKIDFGGAPGKPESLQETSKSKASYDPTTDEQPALISVLNSFFQRVGIAQIPQENAETVSSPQSSNPANSTKSIGIQVSIEEAIEKFGEIELGDEIEELVNEGFEALVRNDDGEKSTLDFVRMYNDEERSLASKKTDEDLKGILQKTFRHLYYKLTSETGNRRDRDNAETTRVLARICNSLARKIQQQINIEKHLAAFSSRAADVVEMGKVFFLNKKYIHAVVAHYAAAKMFHLGCRNDQSSSGIGKCSLQIFRIIKEMAVHQSMRPVAVDHIIPFLDEMKGLIRSIQHSSHSKKVKQEVRCSIRAGLCYYHCGEFQKFADENECAIQFLEKEFQQNAKKHEIYSRALNNASIAYDRLNNIPKAIELCKKALDAKESALDWLNGDEKKKYIDLARKNLELYQEKLRKQQIK